MTALGIGGNNGNVGKSHAPSATAPTAPPAPAPTEATGPSPSPTPSPTSPSNAPQAAQPAPPLGTVPVTADKSDKTTVVDAASPAGATANAGGSSPDAHPAVAEAPTTDKKPAAAAAEKGGEGADTDEDALIRKAVPNAESAVIGEDEAEADATTVAKPKPAAKPHPAPGKPAPEVPRVETAVLHFTSVPAGAVVKTKARVLGRTPIALHFKTGNTYEIVLIKSGYQPATRKVAVHSTADKKIAVALKKTPPPKHSFFHPHR
jgi:hypothetical protein